jgi:hypothetical protein
MKQTNILMKESIFESINPTFHIYATNHSQEHQQPLEHFELLNHFHKYEDQESSYHEKLFYDFQLIQNNEGDKYTK